MLDEQYESDFGKSPAKSALLILIGIVVGVTGSILFAAPHGISDAARSAASEPLPAFSRVGERLIVPPGSPLRSILALEDVTSTKIARSLVLPATVEADPSRTVKVLPPVAGRVVSLKVQLGERVTQGQELAVIDSGDLAQAYSDIEKARSVLTLTKKVLDRQMGLEKAGGAAIKDREQAQSDYNQAVAELDRAES